MKLVSCYIENFGGLSGFSMDFAPGLTVIREDNGFGKTTLAEFIRAMFYGFPRKSPKQLGRRQKYRPWNGGKCGGHLTFEHEGKRYRIERSFGATPRGDSFRLMDLETGKPSGRFSEEIGLELFGLDADSFERSTYLPQSRDTGPLTTDSIRAKLGNLVEDTGDVGNFEKAMKTLREKRSGCVPYRGGGGAVAEAQAEITRLQRELDDSEEKERRLSRVAAELARRREEQARLQTQIGGVRQQMRAASEAAARLSHHQHHDRLAAALTGTEEELAQLKARYPKGFPTAEDLEAMTDRVEQAARLAAQPPVTAEDQKAARFVEEHGPRLAGGVPNAAEFDGLRQTWDDRRMAQARLDACELPRDEKQELEWLKDFFAPGVPEEEVLRTMEQEREEAERLRRENIRLAAQDIRTVPVKVSSPLTAPLLLGCGVASLLVGILLLVTERIVPGTIALVLGLLALLGAGYVNLRAGMTRQVAGLDPRLRELIRENEERAASLEASVQRFVSAYEDTAPVEIRRRAARLVALTEREASFAKTKWELNAVLAELDAGLDGFYEKYRCRPEGDSYDAVNRFHRLCETWERAQSQLRDRDRRQEQRRLETEAVRTALEGFAEKYGVLPRNRAQVQTVRDDVRRAGELASAAEKLGRQLEEYRRAHADALASPAPDGTVDPAALRRQEAELLSRQNRDRDELLRLEQERLRLREAADRIPDLRDALARRQAEKEEGLRNAALLDDTMDFLHRAKDRLATTYMDPIRQNFISLMGRMAGEDAENILVTAELEVRLERFGAGRELAWFSAGQTDLVSLCMRLALVDALFREAKPFVILDDPFVNLDDGRMKRALALLEELSRDRQIVYLVCSRSRVSESFVTERDLKKLEMVKE